MTDPVGRTAAPFDVLLATHRRSGTHVMLEYLQGQLGRTPQKSHDFPLANTRLPTIYLVRNPVDVMWSTYRWFCQGCSSNGLIAAALDGVKFSAYLAGEAGPLVGYDSMRVRGRDSFHSDRGMLYDPIRYWADHVRAFQRIQPAPLLVRYESLVANPAEQIERVARHLGLELAAGVRPIGRDELVGHAPSPGDAPPALLQWDSQSLNRLSETAGDVLEHFGYEVPTTARRTPSPRRAHPDLRYVSRDDNSGYAVAGRRCIDALATAGLDVTWEPQPNEWGQRATVGPRTPPSLLERYRPDAVSDITVLHTMPEWWAGLRSSFGRSQYIGHTVWELEQYPDSWHRTAFAADRLWVPTEWNRRTFQRGAVKQPIDVLPHVISSEPVDEPPIELPRDVTVFVTVASWHPRKRPDLAVEAFARAFRRGDPVLLVVKTAAWTDSWPAEDDVQQMTWWQLMQVLRRHEAPPDVMLVNDEFTDAEVNGLVARADCYVSLARAEGWGLGMFDAAVMGTPVITTGFGGHLAFLGADHPGLVPYRMEPVGGVENSPHFEPGMEWAAPDLDVVAAMMRAVVDGTSALTASAPALAERLRTTFSPQAVGRTALALLEAQQ